jgi:NAD(P)-dependent dehydrogenase (short-subunit alcohol dehydrogenase family)
MSGPLHGKVAVVTGAARGIGRAVAVAMARAGAALVAAGKQPGGTPADEETVRGVLATASPLGVPWIEPEQVAPVVVFLASDAARMVSGAAYDVTAGDSAHYTV